ncbi:MAG TPA: bifunctional DNA-binding transcriptional regulator/O6-methylguanine-DNA methyltransferase Ada [Candidatus Acidoferrales bacterium]|nr:bifunctional DNA-binding transcriptional regulator/O6-methylguanine-DNA methyltransferase Ada [Candidatus Acidoferrales bacterium]
MERRKTIRHAGLPAESCWRAVLARDPRRDAEFVFAVRSTGIYCRPSCPSRRPLRKHVLFFTQPEAAEQSGFRPCRRCRPRETVRQNRAALVERVTRHIQDHADEPLRLSMLAKLMGLSPHHAQRVFRRVLGVTPRQFADAVRIHRLKSQLRKGDNVTTSLYEAGYGSSSRLYERSDAQLGMTPATYRRGGRGMLIRYTVVPCPLGRLLVGATERGISAVYLGDSREKLEAALRAEYPHAEIHRDANGLNRWVSAILRQLRSESHTVDLPLDVQATAFQQRVWQALRRIPYGTTRTYGQIARALGKPKATRAVARACASNPVSIVVPCHRVVREDGDLAGYRWGVERKRALLENERAAARENR